MNCKRNIKCVIYLVLLFLIPMARLFPSCLGNTFSRITIIQKLISLICLDPIYVPMYIYVLINVFSLRMIYRVKQIMVTIGRYSLLMWFVHCIFFNNSKEIFQPILYYPKQPLIVLVWGIVICLIMSIILELVLRRIIKYKNKLIFKQ